MSATTMPSARRASAGRAQSQRVPRRLSGPATGRAGARPVPQQSPTLGARALSVVRSLPDHSLLDRLVRGRAWIPVLGVLLAGIVATQVEILKLGTSLGRSLERTTTLQSTNEALQANIASLDDAARIEGLATRMGLVLPSPSLLTFLPVRPQGQLGRAIANIHAPDPAGFAQQLESQIMTAELQAPSSSALGSSSALASGTSSTAGGQSIGAGGSSTSTGSTAAGTTGITQTGGTTDTTGATTTGGTTTTAGGTANTTGNTTVGAGTTGGSPGDAGANGAGSTSPGTASTGAGVAAGAAGLPSTSTLSSQPGTTSGG